MKLLKNTLLLLLVAGFFTLTSCSKDDDDSSNNYTVIGTWALVEMNPPVFDLNECPDKPMITFEESGNADWTFYSQDNGCQGDSASGQWEQNSATEYTLIIPGYEPFTGTVEFSSSSRFTFTTVYSGIPAIFTFEK